MRRQRVARRVARRAARLARGIVDAEVEEEAAAGGDGEAGRQRESLQLHDEWAW